MNKQFTRVALNEGDKEVQHYKKDNFFDEISNTRDEKKFETRVILSNYTHIYIYINAKQ